MTRFAGKALLLGSAALIAAVTLVPMPWQRTLSAETPVWCLVCGSVGLTDVLANLVLFLPLGVGLAAVGVPLRRALLMVVGATVTVEALQLAVIPGRDAALSDVLTNSTGGFLGWRLQRAWPTLVRPQPARARALGVIMAVLAGTIVTGLTSLLQPALTPSPRVWYGQWAPEQGQYDTFPGRVLAARFNGHAMPSRRLDDTPTRRAEIEERGVIELEARFVTGARTRGLAPITNLFDDERRRLLLLGQQGRDLRFEVRLRSENVKLRSPALVILDALPRDSLEARAVGRYARGAIQLEVEAGDPPVRVRERLTAARAWLLVSPFDVPLGRVGDLVGMVWLAMVWFPAGYYSGLGGHGEGKTGALVMGLAAAALVAVFGLFTPLVGAQAATLLDWAGGISGLFAGGALGRVRRSRG